jgi:hypothetical protein
VTPQGLPRYARGACGGPTGGEPGFMEIAVSREEIFKLTQKVRCSG